ncbi:endonuclease/exonuclease/phosphatase family protein [Carnobacterium divergens]|uniref:endonuclease/exonuclease/phosphatase family protein n=1 Tax=Carnobacterium divergens TaxID=2748 RepID=UPI001072766F|nr:endonuclease/exonuclease/phosphatase family protein [Carnobacterium divergens]TFI73987.1 hydrolase [Carnobacterium divergens]
MKIKKFLKIVGGMLGIILVAVLIYVGYVYVSYARLDDQLPAEIKQKATATKIVQKKQYNVTTFNIGYGSYSPEYTFFMDGGKESKAYSKENVLTNVNGAAKTIQNANPDFALFQEVDVNATRSRGINEIKQLSQRFPTYSRSYATNYDSAYLMYPIFDPIGKSKSGIVTMSDVQITESTRYSLPIETNFNKFFDLDRAFTVSKIPVENGKNLMLYNVHLSAYMKDKKVQKEQIAKLFNHMEAEYKKGNYVICGGDFNHDLLETSSEVFDNNQEEEYTWLQAFPKKDLPKNLSLAELSDVKTPVPSVRNLDKPYEKDKSFVAVIDGFIISDNVTNRRTNVIDAGFEHSDHNPVEMTFELN